jgi:hypothetical protein
MAKGRPSDDQRDVYGDWVMAVVNATRLAQRSNVLMSEGELAIVDAVYTKLCNLDKHASGVARAKQVRVVPLDT